VLIVGRGGGSLEDLWAFNEEIVARAIYKSEIPVVSAVGHEIDFTIADFAADLRAPTPSAAAEIVAVDEEEIRKRLTRRSADLTRTIFNRIEQYRTRIRDISRGYAFRAAEDRIRQYAQHLDELINRVNSLAVKYLHTRRENIQKREQHLNAVNPLQILNRGYALVFRDGDLLKSAAGVDIEDRLDVRMHDGSIESIVTGVKHEK
jgi:exodeoxyribonuclease VII large subunit